MPKVCFLIPASPTPGFLSQIAAFDLAIRRLDWKEWRPDILVCFGEEIALGTYQSYASWRRHMPNVTVVFAPPAGDNQYYYTQIDGLFRWAPRDADVLVRADADMLPVANLVGILDYILKRSAIAGTIAHIRFPSANGVSNRDAWLAITESFGVPPLALDYSYSLQSADVPEPERAAPFYLNDGFAFFARDYFEQFVPRYLQFRSQLMDRLAMPYYAGQIALALAAAEVPLPRIALPLRYNFPNDEYAAFNYPEEMENAAAIHYLRTVEFDRQKIFQSEGAYKAFMAAELNKPNSLFRDRVQRLFGKDYPFRRSEDQTKARAIPPESDLPAPGRVGFVNPPLQAERELLERHAKTGALEPLMKAKQSLVGKLGIEEGFARYREMLRLPETVQLHKRSLVGQGEYARAHGEVFVETFEGGRPFHIKAMEVLGEGRCPAFSGVSRATHVALLRQAHVRGNSSLIEVGRHALLEFDTGEPDLFDCE
jgi:hypothetical protein